MAKTYCTLYIKHIQVFLVTLIYFYVWHYLRGVITILSTFSSSEQAAFQGLFLYWRSCRWTLNGDNKMKVEEKKGVQAYRNNSEV